MKYIIDPIVEAKQIQKVIDPVQQTVENEQQLA